MRTMHAPRALLVTLAAVGVILAGAAVDAEPVDGQTFADWTVKCEALPGGRTDQCFVFQNRILRGSGKRLLHVAVGYLGNDAEPVMLFTTPLGVALTQGVSVSVASETIVKVPFQVCEVNGCRAGLRLTEKLLERFESGQEARVDFQDAQRRPIEVQLSLGGLSAGLGALKR